MSGLVVGYDAALFFANLSALAGGTGYHPVDRFLEIRRADLVFIFSCGPYCRLVDQVGKVSTREPMSLPGDCSEVHVLGQRHALAVDV